MISETMQHILRTTDVSDILLIEYLRDSVNAKTHVTAKRR